MLSSRDDDGRRRVGAWLRELREASGLSQEALAEQLSSSQPYVSKVENGIQNVSLTEALQWALTCGCTWDQVQEGLQSMWLELGGGRLSLWDVDAS
jgi:transcriptional regulator with XRE-family HTH domain